MDSNHSSVITGVFGTERFADPCRLQTEAMRLDPNQSSRRSYRPHTTTLQLIMGIVVDSPRKAVQVSIGADAKKKA